MTVPCNHQNSGKLEIGMSVAREVIQTPRGGNRGDEPTKGPMAGKGFGGRKKGDQFT